MKVDFSKIGRPMMSSVKPWIMKNRIELPCLLTNLDRPVSREWIDKLSRQQGNLISAVKSPYHPFLFAKQDVETGGLTFPFREDIGTGKRRQNFEPVFLFVPIFILIRNLSGPIKPFVLPHAGH